MATDWLEIISKLLIDQPGITGAVSQDDLGRNFSFAITPEFSIADVLAQALRTAGIKATSFKIPKDGGHVLVITGLPVSPDAAVPLSSLSTSD